MHLTPINKSIVYRLGPSANTLVVDRSFRFASYPFPWTVFQIVSFIYTVLESQPSVPLPIFLLILFAHLLAAANPHWVAMATGMSEHYYSLSARGVPPDVFHPLFTIARQHYDPGLVGQWYSRILRQVRGHREPTASHSIHGQFSPISPDDDEGLPAQPAGPGFTRDFSGSIVASPLDAVPSAEEAETSEFNQHSDELMWKVAMSRTHETPSASSGIRIQTASSDFQPPAVSEEIIRFSNRAKTSPLEPTPQSTPQDTVPSVSFHDPVWRTYPTPTGHGPTMSSAATVPTHRARQQSGMPPPPTTSRSRSRTYNPASRVASRQPGNDVLFLPEHVSLSDLYRTDAAGIVQPPSGPVQPWFMTQDLEGAPPLDPAYLPANEFQAFQVSIETSTGPSSAPTFTPMGLGIQEGPSFGDEPPPSMRYSMTPSNNGMPVLVSSEDNLQLPTRSPQSAPSAVGMRMLMPRRDLYSPSSIPGTPEPPRKRKKLCPAPPVATDRRMTEPSLGYFCNN